MTKAYPLAAVAALVALAAPGAVSPGQAAGSASSAVHRLSATMTAEQVRSPRPTGDAAKARGSLTGSVTVATRSRASWSLRFSGTTGRVTAAEIRFPGAGSYGVILLCRPCASGAKFVTTFPTRAVAEILVTRARAGKADVVLKTTRNPRGEVRGILRASSG